MTDSRQVQMHKKRNKIGFVSPARLYDAPTVVRPPQCNQNIMGIDVGFCMVSKRQVATYE